MNIRLFLGGLRPPKPSREQGVGKPGFPIPLGCGLCPPEPSRGRGCAETRFPHIPPPKDYVHVRRSCAWRTTPDAHGLGVRASRPHRVSAGKLPALPAYVHRSPPCGSAAQRRNEHKVILGRAAPSQTLPRVGVWGNLVSPYPSPRAYFHISHPCGCAAQHPMNIAWERGRPARIASPRAR